MTFILIMTLKTYSAVTMISIEFSSRDACIAAADAYVQLVKNNRSDWAIVADCYRK